MHAILVTLFLPRLCRVIYNHGDNKYSSLGAIGLRGWFMHVLEIKPCPAGFVLEFDMWRLKGG